MKRKTPIKTLINRMRYVGGRKCKSAWKKLGKKKISEIIEAGFTFNIVPRKKQ